MEAGFIADQTPSGPQGSLWMRGRAEKGFWSGFKMKTFEHLDVTTYRCVSCGYLESYAKEAQEEKKP